MKINLSVKKVTYLLLFLLLGGCASSFDLSSIEGLSPSQPYSEASFRQGDYRFSKSGYQVFGWALQEAIIERRYEDALAALVKANKASDQSYFSLGLIAERLGHYDAAAEYYRLAKTLNDIGSQQVSRCPFEVDKPTLIEYPQACFKIYSADMAEAEKRAKLKSEGKWSDKVVEYKDGRIYVGRLEDGKPEGWGEITSTSGEFYFGRFRDGRQNGPGTLSIKTPSTTLYFKGYFRNGLPARGYLYNPKMKMLGSSFGKVMEYKGGALHYEDGSVLGSKPADNNYWFSGGWGEATMAALKQGFSFYKAGISPLFASEDPLIKRVCNVESSLISGGARRDGQCEE